MSNCNKKLKEGGGGGGGVSLNFQIEEIRIMVVKVLQNNYYEFPCM